MLLTPTTTHKPATDLGYLLYKNPGRVHEFKLTFGKAHVFYPEISEERCTAALLDGCHERDRRRRVVGRTDRTRRRKHGGETSGVHREGAA